MKKLIFVSLFSLLINYSFSQADKAVSGFVLEAQTFLPVENAEVILQDQMKGTITDRDGYFQFTGLPSAKYFISAKHLGYESQVKKINVFDTNINNLKFYLVHKTQDLQEVIIEESQNQDIIISKLPYIETKIIKKQIEESAARDVGDYLRSAINVGGIRKGGTGIDPVVRGFKYSQLNVQVNNGLKIEGGCPNRMDPATAHIEIEDIESIEIIKGPYALKYGPSFGGVINLNTKMPEKSDSAYIHFYASKGYESNWNGNKENIRIEGAKKSLYFNFSGGRKDFGNYKDGDGNEVKSEFMKYNYRGQLGFNLSKNQSLLLNYEESKGRDISFPSLPMDERSDDTRLMSADYNVNFSSVNFKFLQFKIYKSDVSHEMDNKNRPFSDTTITVSKIKASNLGVRIETQMKIFNGDWVAGIDFEQIRKDGSRDKNMILQSEPTLKKEQLWNNAVISNTGLFAEYSKNINNYQVLGALRLDFNQAKSDSITIQHPSQGEIYHYATDSINTEYINFSFSLGLTKYLNKNISLSLSLGRGIRSPDMTERFIILLPVGYDYYDYLGDPRLKPEANNQADFTFKYSSNKTGLLQVNLFYSIINNYISGKLIPPSEQKPLTVGVAGVKQFHNSGNAKMRGAELSYAFPAGNKFGLTIFAAYTYGTVDNSTKFLTSSSGEITGKEEIKNDPMAEIPPYEISTIFSYKFLRGTLTPRLTLRFVGEKTLVSESQFEKPSPGFMVANFSIFYSFNKNLSLSGGVNNILDNAYYEHLNRNIIGTNLNLYEPGRVYYINLMIKI